MSNELTLTDTQDTFTQRQLAALTQIGVQDATPADLAVFLHQCRRTGLDPFAKQIYMIARRSKDSRGNYVMKQTIQTGIDGFRLIARRVADRNHEKLEEQDVLWCGDDGEWHDVWLKKVPPTAAKATIIRGDSKFSAVALFSEYCPTRLDRGSGQQVPTGVWGTKPALMIAKCAEALACARLSRKTSQASTPAMRRRWMTCRPKSWKKRKTSGKAMALVPGKCRTRHHADANRPNESTRFFVNAASHPRRRPKPSCSPTPAPRIDRPDTHQRIGCRQSPRQ